MRRERHGRSVGGQTKGRPRGRAPLPAADDVEARGGWMRPSRERWIRSDMPDVPGRDPERVKRRLNPRIAAKESVSNAWSSRRCAAAADAPRASAPRRPSSEWRTASCRTSARCCRTAPLRGRISSTGGSEPSRDRSHANRARRERVARGLTEPARTHKSTNPTGAREYAH